MNYNTELESNTYKKIQEFIKTLPLETPWRGVVCINILNGFLDTALKSEEQDPHRTMEALDHMFVQMVEIYKTQDVSSLDIELDDSTSSNLLELDPSSFSSNST